MERIIKTAETFQVKVAVCINKYDTNLENTEKIKEFCQTFKLPFTGTIPYDSDAVKAINSAKSIVDMECAAGRAVRDVFDQTMRLFNQ